MFFSKANRTILRNWDLETKVFGFTQIRQWNKVQKSVLEMVRDTVALSEGASSLLLELALLCRVMLPPCGWWLSVCGSWVCSAVLLEALCSWLRSSVISNRDGQMPGLVNKDFPFCSKTFFWGVREFIRVILLLTLETWSMQLCMQLSNGKISLKNNVLTCFNEIWKKRLRKSIT